MSARKPKAPKPNQARTNEVRLMRSMTGYGQAQVRAHGLRIEVEVKCVNHRFLDISLKLPRVYNPWEIELRSLVARHFERGRIDIFVSRTIEEHADVPVQFDRTLLEQLYKMELDTLADLEISKRLSAERFAELKAELLRDLFRRQDVLSIPEAAVDETKEVPLLQDALIQAFQSVQEMQQKEGRNLLADLKTRIATLAALQKQVQGRAGLVHDTLRSKLLERVKKHAPEVMLDEARVTAEVVMLSDRSDITEELVRLGSHLTQFSQALEQEPFGKRLDFLLQEIHREFNTIGSKSQDATLQQHMIDAKIEIEKLREQVQNIA